VRNPLSRFRLAVVLLGVIILYGITGYSLIERWNLLDSFYMVIITISTVGYQEVHPLSTAGRIFTSTLIVVGVATMLYGFGVFAETLAENAFGNYRRERQLERSLNQLRDHFIICGYGRIGTQIVAEFEEHKVPYAVIDQTEEAVGRLRAEGRLHIEGDASSEELLRQAGIERARGLICAVDSDERAVYIVLSARALNANLYILARAGRPESIRRLELAGATRTISPYRMAGHLMAELAVRPALVDVLDTLHHGESEIALEEMLVSRGMAALGKTIEETGLLDASAAKLLALRRRDGTLHVNPSPELQLDVGDLLIALGSEAELLKSASLLK
jgi:voltage-gated potassium channel